MQSLFALHQCKEAIYENSLDNIRDRFAPDLNSMEFQDKALLNAQREEAVVLFEKSYQAKENQVVHTDGSIAKTVQEAIAYYHNQVNKDEKYLCKTLVEETEKIYHYYISVLSLAISFAEVAVNERGGGHTQFIKNEWIQGLKNNEALTQEIKQTDATWDHQMNTVRAWFRDIVSVDVDYKAYSLSTSPTLEEQKKFINHFFKKIILGKTAIDSYFEAEVLRWAEDKEIIRGMVEKTIKSIKPPEQTTPTLHKLSLDWEEDKHFLETLFKGTLQLTPAHKDLISQNTRNWEVERLPLTDRIILEMAIGELLNFPSIPMKVTINEFIELAKEYSTPKSRQFINGILDVIARVLKESGELKKSGRGLMDNK